MSKDSVLSEDQQDYQVTTNQDSDIEHADLRTDLTFFTLLTVAKDS